MKLNFGNKSIFKNCLILGKLSNSYKFVKQIILHTNLNQFTNHEKH